MGVISSSAGTGNFGYYSAYDAQVEAINPTTGQADIFYRVAKVTPGQAVAHCLNLVGCGVTTRIRTIVSAPRTQSVTATSNTCLSYAMRTDAPACSRDMIRVALENETSRQGTVCLEFVNNNSDLTISLLPTSPTICRPTGSASLSAVASNSRGNFVCRWIAPDSQILTTQVISTTASRQFRLTVTDAGGCQDTTSTTVQADTPTISFGSGPTTVCTGIDIDAVATYAITSSSGTYLWSVSGDLGRWRNANQHHGHRQLVGVGQRSGSGDQR